MQFDIGDAFKRLDDIVDEVHINESLSLEEKELGNLTSLKNNEEFKNLKDSTIRYIVRAYMAEMNLDGKVEDVNVDDFMSFIKDCGGLGGFVIEFYKELKNNAPIIDIVVHNPKLLAATKKVAHDMYQMGEYDNDLVDRPRKFADWEYPDIVFDVNGETDEQLKANAEAVKREYFKANESIYDNPDDDLGPYQIQYTDEEDEVLEGGMFKTLDDAKKEAIEKLHTEYTHFVIYNKLGDVIMDDGDLEDRDEEPLDEEKKMEEATISDKESLSFDALKERLRNISLDVEKLCKNEKGKLISNDINSETGLPRYLHYVIIPHVSDRSDQSLLNKPGKYIGKINIEISSFNLSDSYSYDITIMCHMVDEGQISSGFKKTYLKEQTNREIIEIARRYYKTIQEIIKKNKLDRYIKQFKKGYPNSSFGVEGNFISGYFRSSIYKPANDPMTILNSKVKKIAKRFGKMAGLSASVESIKKDSFEINLYKDNETNHIWSYNFSKDGKIITAHNVEDVYGDDGEVDVNFSMDQRPEYVEYKSFEELAINDELIRDLPDTDQNELKQELQNIWSKVDESKQVNEGLLDLAPTFVSATETPDFKEKFNVESTSDIKDAKEKIQYNEEHKDDEVIQTVVDLDAKDKDELKKDYTGKWILVCRVCDQPVYKDKEDVIKGEIEGEEAYNIKEECPNCHSMEGYRLEGQVKPIGAENEEPSEDETMPEKEPEEPVTDKEPEAEKQPEGETEIGADENKEGEEPMEKVDVKEESLLSKTTFEELDESSFNKAISDYLKEEFKLTEGSINHLRNTIIVEGKVKDASKTLILEAKEMKDKDITFVIKEGLDKEVELNSSIKENSLFTNSLKTETLREVKEDKLAKYKAAFKESIEVSTDKVDIKVDADKVEIKDKEADSTVVASGDDVVAQNKQNDVRTDGENVTVSKQPEAVEVTEVPAQTEPVEPAANPQPVSVDLETGVVEKPEVAEPVAEEPEEEEDPEAMGEEFFVEVYLPGEAERKSCGHYSCLEDAQKVVKDDEFIEGYIIRDSKGKIVEQKNVEGSSIEQLLDEHRLELSEMSDEQAKEHVSSIITEALNNNELSDKEYATKAVKFLKESKGDTVRGTVNALLEGVKLTLKESK